MWLKFGVDEDGTLVSIEDVTKGKTSLKCPYCNRRLTAKKGKIKEHHFAHTVETCRPVSTRDFPVLPLYDNFNIHLSGQDLKQLKLLWKEYGSKNYFISSDLVPSGLIRAGLLQKNVLTFPPQYEFTNLGKIPVGSLTLMLFNEVQEPLLLKKLLKLELAVEHAKHKQDLRTNNVTTVIATEGKQWRGERARQGRSQPAIFRSACVSSNKNALDLDYRLTDLKLYCAQLKRVLSCTLYFLEIQTNKGTLYKIGVTQRPIRMRIAEVEMDLRAHYQSVDIKVLGTWEHRGNVEKYFKHRYHDFNHKIGSLTEYYKFNTENAKNVLNDLHQMKPKVLSQNEMDILEETTIGTVRLKARDAINHRLYKG